MKEKRVLAVLCVVVLYLSLPLYAMAITSDEIDVMRASQKAEGLHLLWDIPFNLKAEDLSLILETQKGIRMEKSVRTRYNEGKTIGEDVSSQEGQELTVFGVPFSLTYESSLFQNLTGYGYTVGRSSFTLDFPNHAVSRIGLFPDDPKEASEIAYAQSTKVWAGFLDAVGKPEMVGVEYVSDYQAWKDGKCEYVKGYALLRLDQVFVNHELVNMGEIAKYLEIPSENYRLALYAPVFNAVLWTSFDIRDARYLFPNCQIIYTSRERIKLGEPFREIQEKKLGSYTDTGL